MSRNGIVYNLNISPYRITIDDLTFYFSSINHLEKFSEKLNENRKIIKHSLSMRFGFTVNITLLADIVLYSRVETRGFLITSNGRIYQCKKDIILSGGKVTKMN